MVSKDLGEINPEQMDELQKFVISKYLENNLTTALDRHKRYSVSIFDDENNITTDYLFSLKHSVIARQRKAGKTGLRYEIISSDKLGSGGEGTVYLSVGNFSMRANSVFFKPKKRGVKVGINKAQDIAAEYHYSHLAKHLHAKPVSEVRYPNHEAHSYLTMRYFTGSNLNSIIEAETASTPRYNTDERLQKSIDILIAIQKQVHAAGIIHRDIKPENIMITDKGKIKIIDYSYCKEINDISQKPDPRGTIVTMPPEQFFQMPVAMQKYTIKSDNYAAGKTLAEFWHAEAAVNLVKVRTRMESFHTFYRYACADTKFDYSHFLSGDLSDDHVTILKNVMENLSRTKPENRWSLDQAITSLQQIQTERLASKQGFLFHASKS